jgi:hypothetical protein
MAASTPVSTRQQSAATRRRAVVLGAARGSEAGPAGAAVGAVTAGRVSRTSSAPRASSATRARTIASRASKGSRKFHIKGPGSLGSGALFAEYFAAVVIIILDLFTQGPAKGYTTTMAKVMIRLTALTAVFFVLFLMTGSKRGGQAAIWIGLIIDLGVVFTAARAQTLATASDEISGTGSGITLDASNTALTAPPVPARIQLPDE